ncbi:hypothetical protein TRICI_005381 [Trichomonascus ciferrii]|uniref:Uncharacterized protein n=1 Tax=Trichomonascus ciferrii TaxID=44093 RepID=A0A642UUX3_9ASCO|nr:hypothetical protein TRICI_005381 [Trichomonascus ciferrii]
MPGILGGKFDVFAMRGGRTFFQLLGKAVKEVKESLGPWDAGFAVALARCKAKGVFVGHGLRRYRGNVAPVTRQPPCGMFWTRRCFSSMRCPSTTGLTANFWQHNNAATLSRQLHNVSLAKRAGISSLFKDSFKLNRPNSYVAGYGRFLLPATDFSPCKALHRLWQNQTRAFVTQSTNFEWNNSPAITISGFRESGLRSFSRLPPLEDVEHDFPYVDFDVSPQFTIPANAELTEEVVSTIEQDLNRYVEHVKAIVRDIKNVSELGELPVSIENGAVRIHFPNCDTEKVHRLISDVDVSRGVVSDEGNIEGGVAVAGAFSSDGDSSFTQVSGSSSDLYVESLNSEDIPTPSLTRDTESGTRESSSSSILLV